MRLIDMSDRGPTGSTSTAVAASTATARASLSLSAVVTILAGCSAGGGPSSCSQAVVTKAPFSNLEPGSSGFVHFQFTRETLHGPVAAGNADLSSTTNKETKQCTALFDYPVVGGERRVRVWTASHCAGRDLAELTGIKALVSMGDSYVEIPLTHDYVELKRRAAERVAAIAPAETVWKTIFAWNLALEAQPVSAPACRNPVAGVSTYQADPGTQDLCFSWSDLLTLVAEAPGDELKTLLAAIPAHDFTLGLSREGSDLLAAHGDLTNLKRELAVAKAVDSYFECKRFLASGRTPSAADCTRAQDATYAEVLKAHAFPGRDMIAEAEAKGFSSRKGAAEEDAQRRLAEARTRLVRTWRYVGNRITTVPSSASVVAADKGTARFHELRLPELGAGSRYVVEENGLRVRAPKAGQEVTFGPGDSGSILSLEGKAPLLALQSVDNGETSGGASVIALPVRRSAGASDGTRQRSTSGSDTRAPESGDGRADAPGKPKESGCG